jgi:hypothetical protein
MSNQEEEVLNDVSPSWPELFILISWLIYIQRLKAALWWSIGKIVDEETVSI